jgi:hypothetical protein
MNTQDHQMDDIPSPALIAELRQSPGYLAQLVRIQKTAPLMRQRLEECAYDHAGLFPHDEDLYWAMHEAMTVLERLDISIQDGPTLVAVLERVRARGGYNPNWFMVEG